MTKGEFADETTRAVLQCQDRFWLALQRQDPDLFTQVLAEDFVCSSPGQEDQDRADFIRTLTSIPLTVLNVTGEAIRIRIVRDVAVLTGIQIAQMHLPNGETISQRLALTNVFQRTASGWQMILAHPVSLPEST
jgi:ketosteroid isomerase-like protein